jgi:hypothetical protein
LKNSKRILGLASAFNFLILACGDSGGPDDAGAGVDVTPADAGVRALCPVDTNPPCVAAETCGTTGSVPANCPFCPPYNPALCALGCQTPALLETADTQTVSFVAQALGATPESFGGLVLATETAGGRYLTCQDVYDDAARALIVEPCVNVLDSRWADAQREGADTYRVSFSRFASELPVLFVIYAFSTDRAEGVPIGVACTAHEVGAVGSGALMIPGDSMRAIQ